MPTICRYYVKLKFIVIFEVIFHLSGQFNPALYKDTLLKLKILIYSMVRHFKLRITTQIYAIKNLINETESNVLLN
jgi:hypothetical protein